jgi:transcriptional regulator with PAS, ATPase and Fis domain
MNESETLKARLEAIVAEMVERGILFEDACEEFEHHFINAVLARNKGNVSRAAAELGIHRNTLSKRVRTFATRAGKLNGKRRARKGAK